MAFIHTDTFETLRQIVQGDNIISSDEGYQESLVRWSKLAEKAAGAIIFVKTNQDVSEVIQYAVKHNIDLAIKGQQLFSSALGTC